MAKFKFLMGDVNWQDYGGKFYRKTSENRFHIMEVMNTEDWGDSPGFKYCVDLSEIDLDMITNKMREEAKRSCGWEGMDNNPLHIVEMHHSYGHKAPLGEWCGNNLRKLMKNARELSQELDDPSIHENHMNKSVNALGSTAREFMTGDFSSGMLRGISNNDMNARITGKMYGITEEKMDSMKGIDTKFTFLQFKMRPTNSPSSVPSDDPLAFITGFMAGVNGSRMEDERKELADAYLEGYKYGISVRNNEKDWPTWAK